VAGKRRCGLLHGPLTAIVGQRGKGLLNGGRCAPGRHLDRDGGDAQAARAELLVLETQIGKVCAMVGSGGDEPRLDIDGLRHQQRLGHAPAGSQPFQEPVVEHTLVGRVLVDED
jgi:hypothetical protein